MKLRESEDEDELEEETENSEDQSDDSEAGGSDTDNVGDPSVEINVEELIHEIELQNSSHRSIGEQAAKRRLEELMEQKRAKRDLEDFDDYEI